MSFTPGHSLNIFTIFLFPISVLSSSDLRLVFNRVQGSEDLLRRSAGEIGLEVFGCIPQDEIIGQYDLVGRPIMELPATSPGLAAVRAIVEGHVLGQ